MTVALYDLVRDRSHANSQLLADKFFDLGRNGGVCAYCTRDFAHGNLFQGRGQASLPPAQFVYPESQLEAKGHRFGMDTMRASYHQRVFVLSSGLLNRLTVLCQGLPEQYATCL